ILDQWDWDYAIKYRAVNIAGGVANSITAAGLGSAALATSETGVGTVLFGGAAFIQADAARAKFMNAWTGTYNPTLPAAGAEWAGFSPQTAEHFGAGGEVFSGVAASTVL